MRRSVGEVVREIVEDQLGLAAGEAEDGDSFEALGADSLDLVEIVLEVETELEFEPGRYGYEPPETIDLVALPTVGSLVSFFVKATE